MSPPISSHTEIVMLPVLSATLQDLTSWPSLVLVTRPISRTIKTTFKFFSPALMSFMKRGGSLTPSILRQVLATLLRRPRWAKLPTLRGQGQSLGGGGEVGNLGRGWRPGSGSGYFRGRGDQPWRHHAKRKKGKKKLEDRRRGWKKKKDAHKFQNQKDDALARHTVWAASQRGCVRTAASAAKGLGGSGDGPARPSLAAPRTHAHARTHARTLARATPPSPAPGKGP